MAFQPVQPIVDRSKIESLIEQPCDRGQIGFADLTDLQLRDRRRRVPMMVWLHDGVGFYPARRSGLNKMMPLGGRI